MNVGTQTPLLAPRRECVESFVAIQRVAIVHVGSVATDSGQSMLLSEHKWKLFCAPTTQRPFMNLGCRMRQAFSFAATVFPHSPRVVDTPKKQNDRICVHIQKTQHTPASERGVEFGFQHSFLTHPVHKHARCTPQNQTDKHNALDLAVVSSMFVCGVSVESFSFCVRNTEPNKRSIDCSGQ